MTDSTDSFDPSRWAAPPTAAPPVPATPRPTPPPQRRREPFLKGPVPWAWLTAAAALPGKALAVGLAVWFRSGCEKSRTVGMALARLCRMGMSASTARRGLRALERAALVSAHRRPGRAARVTLLDPPATPAPAGRPKEQPPVHRVLTSAIQPVALPLTQAEEVTR